MLLLLVCSFLGGQLAAQQKVALQPTPRQITEGKALLLGVYNPEQKLRLTFSLRPPHMEEEEQYLRELQDQSSPQFHKYLTQKQWNARFAPSAADEQAVVDWALSQELTVTQRYANRLIVDVEGPAGLIGSALEVVVNRYQMDGETYFSNDRAPSIPAHLAGIVQAVHGLNNMQVMQSYSSKAKNRPTPEYAPGPVYQVGPRSLTNGDPAKSPAATSKTNGDVSTSSYHGGFDPPTLSSATAYDYNALTKVGHCCNPLANPNSSPPEASIAIVIWGDFADADVNAFFTQFGLASNLQRYFVDGTAACCDIEATLDVEWSTAMSNSFGSPANTAQVHVYEAANNIHATIIDTLNRTLADGHARVLSMSWGAAENDDVDGPTMDSYHAVFNQLVGQGWTLVAASGDNGATTGCRSHLAVSYPASDPNVNAVGGTQLSTTAFFFSSEWAWNGGYSGCAVNDGGSGGGCSTHFAAPNYQAPGTPCGALSRGVPDIALNAAPDLTAQIIYFQGDWVRAGGTSLGAPELAGLYAQENAYLLYVQSIVGATCGPSITAACAPMGNANYYLYAEGYNQYAPHFPFYDVTFGCNQNDVTSQFGLGYFCANAGYDLVTGWGSANMLQLAWAINSGLAGDAGGPSVSISGPIPNHWYNTNQLLTWTVADTSASGHRPNGVGGYSIGWDVDPGDTYSEPTPIDGLPSSFYDGPQTTRQLTGQADFRSITVGCHTLFVRAWDNTGQTSAPTTYGPVCFDNAPPSTIADLYGTQVLQSYVGPVLVALSPTDLNSGVASSSYQIDGGRWQLFTRPASVGVPGPHTVRYYSTDIAGNVETVEQTNFTISSNFDSTLAIAKPGSGSGTVTSGDGDIFCGDVCSHVYWDGMQVDLTATPAAGSVFTGWNGCDFVVGNICSLTVGADRTVNAVFSVATPLRFVPVTPCRVADTRLSPGPFGGPSINPNDYRDFVIPDGPCGIPRTAAAYSLNVAVVPHGILGFMTVWPSGLDRPTVSTMNSLDGRIKSNAAIVPAGANSAVSVYATNTTDAILDINGYFVPATDPNGLAFYPLAPCRVVDTRKAVAPLGGPSLVGQQVRDFPIFQNTTCGIPPTARAYSMNFAVIPTGTLGFLTAWPADQQQPLVSTLNDLTGTITANAAIVPAAQTTSQGVAVGDIDVYVTNNTDLVVDINGYFAPMGAGGQSLYTVAPCRVLDTRRTTGAFSGLLSPPIDVVDSTCGIPSTAKAVVANATVIPLGELFYLTMWPDGQVQPIVSTLNAIDAAITNNMAVIPMTDGSIDALAAGPTQLILDIFSYFAP